MEPTSAERDAVKAQLRPIIESYVRSSALSHLRDEQAVKQYIEHQTDAIIENILRNFKLEKR